MRLGVATGEVLLRLLGATWRVERVDVPALEAARRASPGGNVIYAVFHNALLVLGFTHRDQDVAVLVSQHRDGEFIARILERLGYGLVRGSTRRGGVEALFRMATLLEAGRDIAITVDGPIGPRYTVHPGAVLLARRTGRPIVPVVAAARRQHELPTWDALRVPAPGSQLRIRYGASIGVASDAKPADVARAREALEAALRSGTLAEEARFGRAPVLDDVQDRRSVWERASEAERPPLVLRAAARAHGAARALDRRWRPRPPGAGTRPWVVGVGNLEAGGTGKTPCVIELAMALASSGRRVAVLTRGHGGALGRRPEVVGPESLVRASDETRLLYARLGGAVPVLVARDKAAGLEVLRRRGDLDVVVVDDAFQTAALEVDAHLVLLDWRMPFGNGFLLPAGRLRDGPGTLRRAAAILFTRAPAANAARPAGSEVLHQPSFLALERFAGLRTPAGAPVAPESLRGAGVALLSGLGRPQAFEALCREVAAAHGIGIRRSVRVGDHAPLEPALRKLAGRLEALGCRSILTSAKDQMRLPAGSKWNEPLLVVEQRLEIPDLPRLLEVLVPAYCCSSA